MITRTAFADLDRQVLISVKETIDYLKEHCTDYVLFLASGEYKAKYEGAIVIGSPFVIDDREDRIKDESRLNFFVTFMRQFYGFPRGMNQSSENENLLHLELMVYSHIWESKPLLKRLYRIADLVSGKCYPWEVNVPDRGKHDFIITKIRGRLQERGLNIWEVIQRGFHTSLRNAFAHSEYAIYTGNKSILLDNYKGADWEIDRITLDDWSLRFCYSALLSYHLFNEFHTRRASLIEDFGTDTFPIVHYLTKTKFQIAKIIYNERRDSFHFEQRRRRQ